MRRLSAQSARVPAAFPPQAVAAPSEVRAAFLKLLDRPRVALDPQARETKSGFAVLLTSRVLFSCEHPSDRVNR